MPVRIYEIAKKLGIESKEVLAKAKDLGIVNARVASSTLDKITAEYLEQHLPQPKQAESPTPPPPVETAPVPVVPAPIILVTEAPPPEAPPPVEPVIAETVTETASVPPAEPVEAGQPAVAAEPAEIPVSLSETTAAEVTPAEVVEPPVLPGEPAPQALAGQPEAPAQAPVAPPPPPPAPPAPVVPRIAIGEKVGFIQLPTRPAARGHEKPPVKTGPPQRPGTPGRGEPVRPDRFGRSSGPGSRPAFPAKPAPASRGPAYVAPPGAVIITMKPPIAVRELADKLNRKPYQIIADLMELNVFANVNQTIEEAVAIRVCAKHGFKFELEKRDRAKAHTPLPKKEVDFDPEDRVEDLKPRAPVVTIMGHVDHGKTSLLDVIRKSDVVSGEAGGITQHIGAYTISFPHPEEKKRIQQITFLDTPGHAAFSSMRARGANVTDLVVLVVAANDGVMPQTLEALSHAQAARVPILVAINKCDHPNANPLKVRQQLNDKGLVPDDWGGNTIYVECSALTKQGVDKLLGMIILQADMLELKANPDRLAKGNVIESGLEPGGPTATVLVRKGTLRVGEVIICGQFYGKVRALINEDGKRLKEAGPSVAVKVLGLNGVPQAGHQFQVVENEKAARVEAEQQAMQNRKTAQEARPARTIETIFDMIKAGNEKVLKVVVKADTQGSVEAIVEALKKIESTLVSLEVVHHMVGTISKSDVELAVASGAVILGFHTRVDGEASEEAKRQGVQIKLYAIIYELIDEVKAAMAGLLDPILKETVVGAAEVRKVFALSKGGNVAGCMVAQGRIARGKVRIVRRKNVVYEGLISSLRRFQDEANEVRAGMECGIRIDGFNEFQEGDSIESYQIEKIAQKLE